MIRLAALLALIFGAAAKADGEKAGDFDYYVLALSWNASWCEAEGDARGADQCDARHDFGFTLHGLWPQNEKGWPAYCRTVERDPSRADTALMADIMGSGGLAWHQWKKHGRCSGLSAQNYLDLSRFAFRSINRPDILRRLPRDVSAPPSVIEDAFLEANPGLEADQITITCRDGFLREARICLTRDLEPRRCGRDVIQDCSARSVTVPMMR